MLSFVFLLLQTLFALYIFYFIIAFLTGAPFVPSTKSVVNRMIELAQIKKGETVFDLGSGDGRLLLAAASKGAHAIGFEINPILVWVSSARAMLHPKRKLIRIIRRSFWKSNLASADVLFVYLLPWRMEHLEQKILRECKKGCLIVSNSFVFPNLTKIAHDTHLHVYVYRR